MTRLPSRRFAGIALAILLSIVVYSTVVPMRRGGLPRPPLETTYPQGIEALVPLLFMQFMAVVLLGWFIISLRQAAPQVPTAGTSAPGWRWSRAILGLLAVGFALVTGSGTLGVLRDMGQPYRYYSLSPPPIYLKGDPLFALNLGLSFMPLLFSAGAVLWISRLARQRSNQLRRALMSDASELRPPLPEQAASMVERLQVLGFTRLGESLTQEPGQPSAQAVPAWYFVDEGRHILAKIHVPPASTLPPSLILMSHFPDGAVVDVRLPFGQRMRRPDLLSDHVADSGPLGVAAAYELQRGHVQSFRGRHGEPLPIGDIATAIARGKEYNARHLATAVRHFTRRLFLLPLGFVAVSAVGAGLTLTAALTRGLVANVLTGFVFPTSFLAVLVGVAIGLSLRRRP